MTYNDINQELAAKHLFDKVKNIKLTGEWSDDHIPCATVSIELHDGTIHDKINLLYLGADGVAAIKYYPYPQAQLDFLNNCLPQIVESAIDAGFDYAATVKYSSQEEADELDQKSERVILELAGLDINKFEVQD